MIASNRLPIDIFMLDTGRLPQETHALAQRVRSHYRLDIEIFVPDTRALQDFLAAHGPDGIYNGIDIRKACCHVRKMEPLKRALVGKKAWVTGC
ncbi:phosphoadenosine phosphosulfate reductase family protein, partial [Geoalkalibacter halelectricus]|uniref:phosphoadenosine phosphosulfate reductase domain-containing protein n=1 Tax=Geoalkalibacter halelectricus TaxID=2847045 RepID=UPI003D2538D5